METFFGFICPKCSTTVQVGVGTPSCPTCGTQMVPNSKAPASAGNVMCKRCNTAYGLITADRCPQCGGPFSAVL